MLDSSICCSLGRKRRNCEAPHGTGSIYRGGEGRETSIRAFHWSHGNIVGLLSNVVIVSVEARNCRVLEVEKFLGATEITIRPLASDIRR